MAATVLIVKAAVHRAGPPGSELHHFLGGYFPSGHTATALVCVGTLAAQLGEVRPGLRHWLRWAVAGWTTLVALAMVFRQYHWLTDVVASAGLGLLILRRSFGSPASRSSTERRPDRWFVSQRARTDPEISENTSGAAIDNANLRRYGGRRAADPVGGTVRSSDHG
jgi:membrane-associated phospholipid phosphatase